MRRYALQLLLVAAWILLASAAFAQVRFFDMGTADSKVYEGATRVTAADVYSRETGFGWRSAEGLSEQSQAQEEMGDRRGSPAPPVIWTNAITEDCVMGETGNAFVVDVPEGDYRVYLLSGTSDPARYFIWDFRVIAHDDLRADLPSAEAVARVQIREGQQHRPTRLRATVTSGTLAVRLSPLSRWLLSAVIVAPEDEWERVEREIVAPLEEWTFFLPPHVQEDWRLDPRPEPGPMPELSAEDRERGWVLFQRPWPEVVWHNTRPRAEEIDRAARIFASPGEYEPITVCVHLLRDVGDLTVETSDVGPVSADEIDIRHVRYMRARPNYVGMGVYRIVPDVLQPMWMFHQREIYDPAAPVGLEGGVTHRFWLTLRVPEDAEPGVYEGRVTVRDDAGGEGVVPVRLRVLPIELREDPSKIWGMYYRHPLDNWSRAQDEVSRAFFERQAEMEHQDLVEHGMHNIRLSAWCRPPNDEGEFEADWTLLERKLELCERYGFTGPYATDINASGIYQKYMGESWGSHTENAKTPPPQYAEELTAMTRFIESERERYGWPEFVYYPIDEPGRDPASVELLMATMQAIRAGGGKTYLTAAPEHEQFQPLMPHINVWCTQTFIPDRETVLADMAARDVQYWCYPNKSLGECDHTTVSGGRMTYGFGFWRSGFVALIPWIYSSTTSDPLNYLTGAAMDFLVRHEPDGTPMTVTIWEAFREGKDDYRYVYTLEQLIAEARASGDAGAAAAAEEAQRELDYVWESINVLPRYQYDGLWPAGDFDAYRWIVAEQIMKVQETLN
ncbi:MAG: hypothetical protein ACOX9R_16915 [Armatimonadota bacterium]|jgi:hypothetical protein